MCLTYSISVLIQRPRRIACYCMPPRYALGDHCTHTNDGTTADDQWSVRQALLDNRAGPNVGMVFDMHISIAHHTRREGNKIADHTIMLNIAIKVGMEMSANPDVARKCDEGAQNSALTQLNIVKLHHVDRTRLEEWHTIGCATLH